VVFTSTEIIFYACVSVFGVVGGVIRHWRDGGGDSRVRSIGRCLSSWVVAFGVVGLWIGNDPSSVISPFYYLAVSTLVGYVSPDIQERIINRLIEELLRRVGLTEQKKVD
jgi:hypothetical protein